MKQQEEDEVKKKRKWELQQNIKYKKKQEMEELK